MEEKFDLILTKSISRFARNTLYTLKYVKMLKNKNVTIIFEEEGINKIKNTLENNKILDGFDRDVFDALVDYVIIGGYENGVKNDSLIKFICKTNFNETPREEIITERILDNNDMIDYRCTGFINVLDFYSKQDYCYFYTDETGKKRKKVLSNIRVRVEIES